MPAPLSPGPPEPTAEEADARPLQTHFRPVEPLDIRLTLSAIRHGAGDPSVRFDADGSVWRATRTPAGPATVRLRSTAGVVLAEAWGAGREWAVERIPTLLGGEDDPSALRSRNRLLRELQARLAGLRLCRTDSLFEAMLPAIIEQKVTGLEAHRAYRALLLGQGDRAPGPVELRVPPAPERLSALPAYCYHVYGIETRRAVTIRRAAAVAARLDEAIRRAPGTASSVLQTVPGVGPWTAAETTRVALGDADAVSVGDYHVPSLVAWAFAGEPRADDARMLELLEPYRGQRARVVRLLELSGLRPPRFGPRHRLRSIAAF